MLNFETAVKAADYAAKELRSDKYAGANYLCADGRNALVVHGADTVQIVELSPGLHIVSQNDVDNLTDERQELVRRLLTLQRLDSAVAFGGRQPHLRPQAGRRRPPRRGPLRARLRDGLLHTRLAAEEDAQRGLPLRPRPAVGLCLRRSLRALASGALDGEVTSLIPSSC